MDSEPTRLIGYISAAAAALITVAVAFGANIDDDQRNALLTATAACAPVVVFAVELIRSKVTPVDRADKKITEAFFADPAVDEKPTI
jgi:hypothetical protein